MLKTYISFYPRRDLLSFSTDIMLVKKFADLYSGNSGKHVMSSVIDKKNKNKMKKTIEIEEDLDGEDLDLLQYDADLGAEKAILKNMA